LNAVTTIASASVAGRARFLRRWSLLILLSVAQFMVIIDATVVNVPCHQLAEHSDSRRRRISGHFSSRRNQRMLGRINRQLRCRDERT